MLPISLTYVDVLQSPIINKQAHQLKLYLNSILHTYLNIKQSVYICVNTNQDPLYI